LGFDPEKGKFACEFCLSEFEEEELAGCGAAEAAQKQAEEGEAYCEQMNLFTCPNCGAEVVADDDTVADFCYYCHNPVVHAGRLSGQLRPHKIIPFRITREEAQEAFLKWCKSKWFLPGAFKTRAHAAQIQGVYYPFWVTDADAVGNGLPALTQTPVAFRIQKKFPETGGPSLSDTGEAGFFQADDVAAGLDSAFANGFAVGKKQPVVYRVFVGKLFQNGKNTVIGSDESAVFPAGIIL
jgi:hypothetical protein